MIVTGPAGAGKTHRATAIAQEARQAGFGVVQGGAGDVYYGAPGHVPLIFAGTELVEFSPTEQFQQTDAAVEAAMTATGA